jgi:4-alpha-glucanotransferase
VTALDSLAAALGIESTVVDAFGRANEVSESTKRSLVAAMGYGAGSDAEAQASLTRLVDDDWRRIAAPVSVVREDDELEIELTLHSAAAGLRLHWQIGLEGGSPLEGTLRWDDAASSAERTIDGKHYVRRSLKLGRRLPSGYHRFEVTFEGARAEMSLIVAPSAAFVPPALETGRHWALAVQLYGLRRRGDWGIGDFTALIGLSGAVTLAGGSAIAVNPLHRLHLHNPAAASPYGPTSRTSLNPFYVDPVTVPEFGRCPEARKLLDSASFQRERDSLRQAQLVDYERVAALKSRVFALLYEEFRRRHLLDDGTPATRRGAAFRRFCAEGGEALEGLTTYEALAERFRAQDLAAYGWLEWPPAYRDPKGSAVVEFARTNRQHCEYFAYLAWIADEQLERAGAACEGMAVGLYRDLAVGPERNSAEAWLDQELYRSEVSIGAPPDPLNPLGQNWGLPPADPRALRAAAYRPFVELLRSNMRYAGALRIDHVMSLARLFWIPPGRPASEGAYVQYPFSDLLAIVALESRRLNCMIVGEDLGTVPPGFRERLAGSRILSTRVLYFERDEAGRFNDASSYPRLSVASIGTHDLPPLAGWWTGRDIDVQRELGVLTDADANRERESRLAARLAVVDLLGPPVVNEAAAIGGEVPKDDALFWGLCAFLARAPSLLVLISLDDALGETEQSNVPGTVDIHPNWRRRSRRMVDRLQKDDILARLSECLRNADS